MCVYVYVCMCMCVCMCVLVCEREIRREFSGIYPLVFILDFFHFFLLQKLLTNLLVFLLFSVWLFPTMILCISCKNLSFVSMTSSVSGIIFGLKMEFFNA